MASTTSNRIPPEEKLVRKEKKDQEKLLKDFRKAWETKSPKINVSRYIKEYDEISDIYSRPLIDNMLKMLAVVNAVEFANEALNDKFHAEGVAVLPEEVVVNATRLVRIKTLEMLCDMFEMDSNYVERLMGLFITREFGSLAPSISAPPIPKANQPFKKVVMNEKEKKDSLFTRKRRKTE